MENLLILLSAAFAGFMVLGICLVSNKKEVIEGPSGEMPPAKIDFVPRLCRGLGVISEKLLPERFLKFSYPRLLKLRELSGMDNRIWTPSAMVGAHVLGALTGMFLLNLFMKGWPFPFRLLLGMAAGMWYTMHRMKSAMLERQDVITKGFPFALDLVQLCVSSGQSINMAMSQLAESLGPGPVREEFMRLVAAVQHGSSMEDALRRMSQRIHASEIRAVLLALVQAINQGGELGATLKTQSEQLRFNRLMSVEEDIQKLPTRMTLPIILFFMPCMMIMTIGPLAISTVLSVRG